MRKGKTWQRKLREKKNIKEDIGKKKERGRAKIKQFSMQRKRDKCEETRYEATMDWL